MTEPDTTQEAPEVSIPSRKTQETMEREALKVTMSVDRILLSFPTEESRDEFEGMLSDLLKAHMNAFGMEVGMIARAAMHGRPELGVGAAGMQAMMMQQSAQQAFEQLIEIVEGPKVEIAGASTLIDPEVS